MKKLYLILFTKSKLGSPLFQGLRNKQAHTSLIANDIHDSLNIYIVVPNAAHWNSTYKAVECLYGNLTKSELELQSICDKANIH